MSKQKPLPIDKIEHWPLSKFVEYPNNPRKNDHAIDQMAGIISKFGFRVPMLVRSSGDLVDGHLRLKAARKLQLEKLPVILVDDLSEDEIKALRIAVNQAANLAQWDLPLLKSELQSLKVSGFDLPTLGFHDRELQKWGIENRTVVQDPDVIPDTPASPVSVLGDVWVMGRHRLVVGDATLPETWKTLFGKERASMVFTDPPYGVSYATQSGKFGVIEGDDKRRDDLYKMLLKSFREMVKYAGDDAGFYIWHASTTRDDFAQAMKSCGIVERQYLIWAKPSIVLGHSDYSWQHEPCFYSSKGDRSPKFYGDRTQSTVWRIAVVSNKETATTVGNGLVVLDGHGNTLYVQSRTAKNKKVRQVRLVEDAKLYLVGAEQDGSVWEVSRDSRTQHPTQKPVELARRAIENSSQPGEIVADGFLGSGTTLIGAEMTGRLAYGLELDPVYADVIVNRWQTFAGGTAVLEATGHPFSVVAATRLGKPTGAPKRKGAANVATPSKNAPAVV